jgi:hypothetical protein
LLLKIDGLSSAKHALQLLDMGEHLWVLGIGSSLIRFKKLSELSYRVSLYSVWREAMRFSMRSLNVDARVSQTEAYKLVEKLGARPCKLVKNRTIDEPDMSGDVGGDEISYLEYVKAVKGSGFLVQVSP